MAELLLRGARVWGGTEADILIRDGRIAAVGTNEAHAPAGVGCVLGGMLLIQAGRPSHRNPAP